MNIIFCLISLKMKIPVIAPLKFDNESLFECPRSKLLYCIFRRKSGRIPDEMSHSQIEIMGRMLARLLTDSYKEKQSIEFKFPETFALENLEQLVKTQLIPKHFESTYIDSFNNSFKSSLRNSMISKMLNSR